MIRSQHINEDEKSGREILKGKKQGEKSLKLKTQLHEQTKGTLFSSFKDFFAFSAF
jgi:hypothetical protein